MIKRIILLVLLMWLCGVFRGTPGSGLLGGFCEVSLGQTTAPSNLVANGDFSQTTGGQAATGHETAGPLADWSIAGDASDVDQTLSAQKDADGKTFARLICTRCIHRGSNSQAMLLQLGHIKLTKGQTYEFTCRLRETSLRSRTVNVAIMDTHDWAFCGLEAQLSPSATWSDYRIVFRADRDLGASGRLEFYFTEPGTLDLADVRIVEIAAAPEQFTNLAPSSGGKNLVFNGSFSLAGAGWTSIGKGLGWGDLSSLYGEVESAGGPDGKAFLRMPMGAGITPVLYFDYFQPVIQPQLRLLAATRGWITLEKGKSYTLSAYLRASVDGAKALIGVRTRGPSETQWNNLDESQSLKLTTAWKRYDLVIRPQRDYGFVYAGADLAAEPPADRRINIDLADVQLVKEAEASAHQPLADVEFALEPGRAAGIFTDKDPATLTLRLCNHSAIAKHAQIAFAVTDFDDKPVALPDVAVELPAGAVVDRVLQLPQDWRGYYHLRGSAKTGDGILAAAPDIRIAIVPAPSGETVCGMNHAFADARLIHLASDAGVSWYRDWSLKWQTIEPAEGEFHWQLSDAQIDRVLREKVQLMALLPPFPSANWNSVAPESVNATGANSLARMAYPPKDTQAMGEFIQRTVERYKGRIHVWEFLNEPLYTSYALPADGRNPLTNKPYISADYVSLLAVASAAMRKADANCRIIGGVATGPDQRTSAAIDAGCLQYIDLLNLHIYPGRITPESYIGPMDDLLAEMDRHGGRKPIWITEFSYYGADNLPRQPFVPRSSSWAEARLLDSERQCANYTVRFFLVMLSHNVQKIFIHTGMSAPVNDESLECALFDYGGAPRRLFPALAVLTHLMGPKPQCVGQCALGETGHAAAFETGTAAVLAIWSESASEKETGADGVMTFPIRADIAAMDIVGRTVSAANIRLSPAPIYLIGPSGHGQKMLEAAQNAFTRSRQTR